MFLIPMKGTSISLERTKVKKDKWERKRKAEDNLGLGRKT